MRVRMLSARGGYPCGVICEVPDDLAVCWCQDLTAEPVRPEPSLDTAERVPAPETAMRPAGKRMRR